MTVFAILSSVKILDDIAPTYLITYNETPGSNIQATTPEDFFSTFFTDDLWQFLVDNSNEYAAMKLAAMEASKIIY